MFIPLTRIPVTPESAALLAQIENHCTVECFDRPPYYSAWIRAAVDAAADLWALRHGWPPELVRATYRSKGYTPTDTLVAWNATTCVFGEGNE